MFPCKTFRNCYLKGLSSHGVWVDGVGFCNSIDSAHQHFASCGNIEGWRIRTLPCLFICLLLPTRAVSSFPQFEIVGWYTRKGASFLRCTRNLSFIYDIFACTSVSYAYSFWLATTFGLHVTSTTRSEYTNSKVYLLETWVVCRAMHR